MKNIQALLLFSIGTILFSCNQLNPTTEDHLEEVSELDAVQKFIGPGNESLNEFQEYFKDRGKIVMLNLLKFKSVADYTGIEVSDIQDGKTGKETYQHYLNLAGDIFENMKVGRVLYFGESHQFLIGPQNEKWDAIILVEYKSADDFLSFISSEAYQGVAGHRTASLDDSRLLPTSALNVLEIQE